MTQYEHATSHWAALGVATDSLLSITAHAQMSSRERAGPMVSGGVNGVSRPRSGYMQRGLAEHAHAWQLQRKRRNSLSG